MKNRVKICLKKYGYEETYVQQYYHSFSDKKKRVLTSSVTGRSEVYNDQRGKEKFLFGQENGYIVEQLGPFFNGTNKKDASEFIRESVDKLSLEVEADQLLAHHISKQPTGDIDKEYYQLYLLIVRQNHPLLLTYELLNLSFGKGKSKQLSCAL